MKTYEDLKKVKQNMKQLGRFKGALQIFLVKVKKPPIHIKNIH